MNTEPFPIGKPKNLDLNHLLLHDKNALTGLLHLTNNNNKNINCMNNLTTSPQKMLNFKEIFKERQELFSLSLFNKKAFFVFAFIIFFTGIICKPYPGTKPAFAFIKVFWVYSYILFSYTT